MKILVVDDSRLIINAMKTMLTTLGHTVIFAYDGLEASILYKEERPDMVTMDLNMPIVNGSSALKSILEIDSRAKVIIVSSVGSPESVIDSIKDGALGYILKPVTIEKLEEVFKKAK